MHEFVQRAEEIEAAHCQDPLRRFSVVRNVASWLVARGFFCGAIFATVDIPPYRMQV